MRKNSLLTHNSLYNNGESSDVTIKFSGREVKCHKLILCHISEYFKKMCGPGSKFLEARQDVIELHDDDPGAVEVMLRHIYGYQYFDILNNFKQATIPLHMSVFVVAQKYLLPKLEAAAFKVIEMRVRRVEIPFNQKSVLDSSTMVDALKLLSEHREHDERFGKLVTELCDKHLPMLMANQKFRSMIEGEGEKPILDRVLKAVESAHGAKLIVGRGRYVYHRSTTQCRKCKKSWNWEVSKCDVCNGYGSDLTTEHAAKWST